MRTPWMAARNTLHAKPDALYDAPLFNSLNSIMGAAGSVSAGGTQQRREGPLINPYRQYEDLLDKLHVLLTLMI